MNAKSTARLVTERRVRQQSACFLLHETAIHSVGRRDGSLVDLPVEDDHSEHWNPERAARGVDDVTRSRRETALISLHHHVTVRRVTSYRPRDCGAA